VNKPLHEYFGYTDAADLEKMAGTGVSDGIHEFLRRSGIKYTELIDLVNSRFINPHLGLLTFLEGLFGSTGISGTSLYDKLKQIHAGTLNPATDADLMTSLSGKIEAADFTFWIQKNFDYFNEVITLYQSKSMCDLNTTYLKT